MLTPDEEKFLQYWEENRIKEKSFFRQISLGLPIGILIGVGLILNFATGWYSRATMVANGQSTPMVLLLAIVIISIFCSIFYKRHRWEMNEQRFMELQNKLSRNKPGGVQQTSDKNSH